MRPADDPRLGRFLGRSGPCSCCGRTFAGVFDVTFDHPDPWPHGNRGTRESIGAGEDFLSAEFCWVEGQGFIRCILPFPVIGTDERFSLGVWGSASEENFRAHVAASRSGDFSTFPRCFSWLANGLPVLGATGHVACTLTVISADLRPELRAQDPDGAVGRHQREGITFDELLDIYAAVGQDMRPHLTDA